MIIVIYVTQTMKTLTEFQKKLDSMNAEELLRVLKHLQTMQNLTKETVCTKCGYNTVGVAEYCLLCNNKLL